MMTVSIGGPTFDCIIWLLVDTNQSTTFRFEFNQMFHSNVGPPLFLCETEKQNFAPKKFSDKFLTNQQMATGTVLGITLMKQLNVRRCKRLRVAKGPVTHIL